MKKKINISSANDAINIVRFATTNGDGIYILKDSIKIDAKSFLGVVSLIAKENLQIELPDDLILSSEVEKLVS